MKKTIRMVAMVACLAVLFTGSVAVAQTRPMTPAQPSQEQAPAGTHTPGQQSHQPMMGQGMMMCPMMGQSMMGMGMGPGMMGGMMGMSDPKAQARMLKLRGDMMKAMGEVLLKHAQEMEQAK
jgi:hypothetical protein